MTPSFPSESPIPSALEKTVAPGYGRKLREPQKKNRKGAEKTRSRIGTLLARLKERLRGQHNNRTWYPSVRIHLEREISRTGKQAVLENIRIDKKRL